MENHFSKLDNWIINKINTEYKDDIELLIGHNAYRLDEDKDKTSASFFFPATEKGYKLATNPIIAGVSYDFFPMSWERIERIAAMIEDNASCIGNARILYYRSEADKKRFLGIQDKFKKRLDNPGYMLNKSLQKLDIAMGLYQGMMFEDAMCRLRKAASYIIIYLSNAIAYSNQTWLNTSHSSYINELKAMKNIPKDFIKLYKAIVEAHSFEELKKLCYEMIFNTRQFLNTKKGVIRETVVKQDFKELAEWYQELSYAWREIYHWCDINDPVKTFIRSGFLQSEIDIICEECGIKEMDLLGAFDANDLPTYRQRAASLEKQIVATIKEHGIDLTTYDSIDEFIEKNA